MKLRIVLLFLAFVTVPAVAMAQTSIAVVDIQRILNEAKAAKTIQTQLETQREKFLGELSKQEQQLREDEKKLIDQRVNLKPEEFATKRKDFEQKLVEMRKKVQERKRNLDKAASKALQELQSEIIKVVQAIADEKNFDLVLSRQNVVLGSKELDVTEEAMSRLNSAITEIKLDISQ